MDPVFKETLTARAVQASVPDLIAAVNRLLSQAGCPEDVRRQIDTVADEVLSNIVDYAYPSADGGSVGDECVFSLSCTVSAGRAELCISDSGIPFNPLDHTDPVLGVPSENGGLGIFLCKQLMDEVAYAYTGEKNVLTLVKNW